MAPDLQPAVRAQALTKRYGAHQVLSEVSFALAEGGCLALLGHNGAGKTTLMKLMLGLTRPSGGGLTVLGAEPATAPPEFRAAIGFLPENVAFHDQMTGRETLAFLARLKRVPARECGPLLERVGLDHAADRRVKTYSKGMRQRLGLAQALLGRPRLLLLDEPTTGLDPILRLEFFSIIQSLQREGATVVLSSHILTELEARTDQIAIMNQGRLIAWGTLDQLRRQAGLPLRLRIETTRAAPEVAAEWSGPPPVRVNAHSFDIEAPLDDKMRVLNQLAGLGPAVRDIDLQLPSLDDIYVYFGHGHSVETGEP